MIYKLFDTIDKLGNGCIVNYDCDEYKDIDREFRSAMDNDFNYFCCNISFVWLYK